MTILTQEVEEAALEAYLRALGPMSRVAIRHAGNDLWLFYTGSGFVAWDIKLDTIPPRDGHKTALKAANDPLKLKPLPPQVIEHLRRLTNDPAARKEEQDPLG